MSLEVPVLRVLLLHPGERERGRKREKGETEREGGREAGKEKGRKER